MENAKFNVIVKRVVDVLLCFILLFLMAYQITGEVLHEYLGMLMVILVLVHQFLNIKWYTSIFKGRYKAYRVLVFVINTLLLLSFILTAVSGMAMSSYAVPFMYGVLRSSAAHIIHLGMSYWSFVLMGLHLGLHIPAIVAGVKINRAAGYAFSLLFILASAIGLYFVISNGIIKYLLFGTHFAFFDYDKSAISVFLENISMLLFFSFIGNYSAVLCQKKIESSKRNLFFNLSILLVIVIGLLLVLIVSKKDGLSVHYSGGSTLEKDISAWLKSSGLL